MNQPTRLLKLFDTLIGKGVNQPMTQIWCSVFELNTQSQNVEDDVAICLMALRSEIDTVKSKLTDIGVSEDLLEPGFTRFKNAASPVFINQNWDGIRGSVQAPECRYPFLWAAWVLRNDDEDGLDGVSKSEIEASLASLESTLSDSKLTPYLKSFVQRQITSIRNAMRLSAVQGVEPLREALRKFAGDMKVEDAKIREAVATASEDAQVTLAAMKVVFEQSAEVCDKSQNVWHFRQSLGGVVNDLLLPNAK